MTDDSADHVEGISPGAAGWVHFISSDLSVPEAMIRVSDVGGRLTVSELYLPGPGIDVNSLRALPLGRIEARINASRLAERIRYQLDDPGPDLRRAAGAFSALTPPGRRAKKHWVNAMLLAQEEASGEPQAPAAVFPSRPEPFEREPRDLRLEVPTTRDLGDDFYRAVGALYEDLAQDLRAPAGAIADANHVPVTRVHRWVKEARARGFLAPGRRQQKGS
jgi:hypothetical protein